MPGEISVTHRGLRLYPLISAHNCKLFSGKYNLHTRARRGDASFKERYQFASLYEVLFFNLSLLSLE